MGNKSFTETYLNFQQLTGYGPKFKTAIFETLYMTFVSMIFIIIIGFLIGLVLYTLMYKTTKKKNLAMSLLYQVVSVISTVFRSTPFFLLVILLIPVTTMIAGSFIGSKAAVVPLVFSAAPFFARLVYIAFNEVDQGVLEAADAMGMNYFQLVKKILIPESLPALISGVTMTAVTLVGFTTMAAAFAAGGLGGLAYQDGWQQRKMTVCLLATAIILLLVFIIQGVGDYLAKKADKRLS